MIDSTGSETGDLYSLSGKPGNAWLLPLIGAASAAASAYAYAWINVYSPIAGYVSVLFTALLAGGAVYPLALAGRALRVRSVTTMHLAGAATGLMAIYFAWVFFTWVLTFRYGAPPPLWDLLHSPALLWDFVAVLNEEGWYSIGASLRPSGAMLWAFWAIEAAIVVGGCVLLAPMKIRDQAFCEDCNAWMLDEDGVAVPADEGAPAATVREGGLGALSAVEPPAKGSNRWLVIARQRCPRCTAAAVYRVDEAATVGTDRGNKTSLRPVLPLRWQRDGERYHIERIADLLQAADTAHFASAAPHRKEAEARG